MKREPAGHPQLWSPTLLIVGKIVTYLISVLPHFVRFSRLTKKKKAKMATQLLLYLIISREVMQTLDAPMQMRLCQLYKKSRGGNGNELKKGVLRR